jgi:hypothetical protein
MASERIKNESKEQNMEASDHQSSSTKPRKAAAVMRLRVCVCVCALAIITQHFGSVAPTENIEYSDY